MVVEGMRTSVFNHRAKNAIPTLPKQVIDLAIEVIGDIHKLGWNPKLALSLGNYVTNFGTYKTSELLMTELRARLGTTVMAWENQPGRTQDDVLAVLQGIVDDPSKRQVKKK
jgi:hypothetical protein